jgi:hypothetical protein
MCVHWCRCVGYGSGVWVWACGCAARGVVWLARMVCQALSNVAGRGFGTVRFVWLSCGVADVLQRLSHG